MPEPFVTFRGRVRCTRASGALGLTLSGDSPERPGEPTTLAFSAAAPAEFPESLTDALVERLDAHQYRIVSASREWLIDAAAVHLHREVAWQFYQAIPPRPVPLRRSLFWKAALTLADSRVGLALLRVLRR